MYLEPSASNLRYQPTEIGELSKTSVNWNKLSLPGVLPRLLGLIPNALILLDMEEVARDTSNAQTRYSL